MSQAIDGLGSWLADVYLLTTIVMVMVLPCLLLLKDPARRLSLARGAVMALAVLVVAASIPGLPRITIRSRVGPSQRSDGGSADSRLSLLDVPVDRGRLAGGNRDLSFRNEGSVRDERSPSTEMSDRLSRLISHVPAKTPAGSIWMPSCRTLIPCAYLAGLILTLIWLGVGAIQVEMLRRETTAPTRRILAILDRLAGSAPRRPVVRQSSRIGLPLAIGLVRPMIVLLLRFAETETDARLEAALAHEWAHHRNGDLRLLALLRWLMPVLYAHPAYWWLRRLIRSDQEVLADAAATAATESGRLDYAETLLCWARSARSSAPCATAFAALGIWERPSLLQRRIRFLIDPRFAVVTRCTRRWRWTARLLPPLVSLALGSLTLRPSFAESRSSQEPRRDPVPVAANVEKNTEEAILYAGRVVDPAGNPVVGAKVYVPTHLAISDKTLPAPRVRAATGADGSFHFRILKAEYDAPWTLEPWRESPVVAIAPGFGPAVTLDFTRRNESPLRLARDDVSIEGRILDLDGQPVVGAKVQVVVLLWPRGEGLADWVKALRERQTAYPVQYAHLDSWHDQSVSDLFPEVETRRDGRFTIKSVGRERVVSLLITGPKIETRIINVVTAPFETTNVPDFARGVRTVTYYGPRFDHVAGPTRIVMGTVRDKDTGKPLAGVVVKNTRSLNNGIHFTSTTTDKDGHYRLVGFPVSLRRDGRSNRQPEMLVAVAPEDQPYLLSTLPIEDRIDTPTVTKDFNLKRGIWVRGQVTDLPTGKAALAVVSYFAFADNPSLKEAPESRFATGANRYPCDRDGYYRLVGLPGRGLVAARSADERDQDRYRFGVGAERIAGLNHRPGTDTFSTVPFMVAIQDFHTLAEVIAPAGTEEVVCNIQLDPGRTVKGKALGPNGALLTGCRVSGLADFYTRWERLKSDTSEFAIQALGENATRYVLFLHVPNKLAGSTVVGPGTTGPITLKMEPWGSLSGRIVDADGEPMKGIEINCREGLPRADPPPGSLPDDLIKVFDDGRFQAEGLIPGLKYRFLVIRGGRALGRAGSVIVLKSCETRYLGDVKIEAPGKGN